MSRWYRISGLSIMLTGLFLRIVTAVDPHKPVDYFQVQQYTVNDGLPVSTVQILAQTGDGYLWTATEAGLARFDGVRFTVFDNSNTPVLGPYPLIALHAGSAGRLWIGSRGGGLIRYSRNRFEAVCRPGGQSFGEVWELLESSDGTLWIGTREGLWRQSGEQLVPVPLPEEVEHGDIRALLEDRDGRIWIGTRGSGLVVASRRGAGYDTEFFGLAGCKVTDLVMDSRSTIWAGTLENGAYRIRDNRLVDDPMVSGLPPASFYRLLADQAGVIWAACPGREIMYWDDGTDRFQPFSVMARSPSRAPLSLFEDMQGSLWISTDDEGLLVIRETRIVNYTEAQGLSQRSVFGIMEDRAGKIWSGTIGSGVNILENGRIRQLSMRDGLSSNAVVTILEDRTGSIWLGSLGGGIQRLQNGRFENYGKEQGLTEVFVHALYMAPDGTVWAGCDDGSILQFDGRGFIPAGRLKYRINCLLITRPGVLWAGTYGGGLVCLERDRLTVYRDEQGLASGIVLSLLPDEAGRLWIGTMGGGLHLLQNGRLTRLNTSSGLPDNTIYSMIRDQAGDFWMSSNRGIFRLKKKTADDFAAGRITNVLPFVMGVEHGLALLECNGGSQNASCLSRDGSLWFTTSGGLARIDPKNTDFNRNSPPVIIESIEMDDRFYHPGDTAVMPPGRGNLTIEFTAPGFIVPKQTRFKYRLEGFDENWVMAGRNRSARFTNLSPGRYSFQVQACNSNGIWNTSGASFDFELRPYFYQTTVFTWGLPFLLASLILGACFGSRQFIRYRRLKNKYRGSPLTPSEAEICLNRLMRLIESEKIYRDPQISLQSLARRLKINPRYLSQIINERLNKSFFELINTLRIEEARHLLAESAKNRSVLDVAYEVGFNSKSAFNRVFKEIAGTTPSDFRKTAARKPEKPRPVTNRNQKPVTGDV